MKPGHFISFEGIEGCGKTTQIARLSKLLNSRSIPHTVTREPGGTAVGDGIRRVLLNSETINLTSEAELLLFYASRSQNINEIIKPALDRGEMVICDRFYHASMAYQGYGRHISLSFIEGLTNLVCKEYQPDITILLDIDPLKGLSRARARNLTQTEDEGRFEAEDLDFYGRVREGYLALAKKDSRRIKVIDADASLDHVELEIKKVLGLEFNE